MENLIHLMPNKNIKFIEELSEPWYTLISLGLKKVEGRLNKNRFKDLKNGDIVVWKNNDFLERTIKTKIIAKREYKTFKDYLENEKHNNPLPGINTIEHQLSVYYKYYSQENEKMYGVVAIELEILYMID